MMACGIGRFDRSSPKGFRSGGMRLVGSGGIAPSGGFSGVIGGIGIGMLMPGLLVVDVDQRDLVLLLVELEVQLSTFV